MSQYTDIIKRWRKVKPRRARLYWRRNNMRWRNVFDSDDVCIIRMGSRRHHFKTFEALVEYIEDAEYWQKKKADEEDAQKRVPTD